MENTAPLSPGLPLVSFPLEGKTSSFVSGCWPPMPWREGEGWAENTGFSAGEKALGVLMADGKSGLYMKTCLSGERAVNWNLQSQSPGVCLNFILRLAE